jgi:predicted transcriptional regulator
MGQRLWPLLTHAAATAAAAAATRSEFAKAVGITFKTPTEVFG